jgi:hypothetical protein
MERDAISILPSPLAGEGSGGLASGSELSRSRMGGSVPGGHAIAGGDKERQIFADRLGAATPPFPPFPRKGGRSRPSNGFLQRLLWLSASGALSAAVPAAAGEPLEKQFYDYFTASCEKAMKAEWTAQKLDPDNPAAHAVMVKYCSCTSQSVVSYLNAGEIIAFAVNPEQEPAAGKMKPHFLDCQERARKVGSNLTGGG